MGMKMPIGMLHDSTGNTTHIQLLQMFVEYLFKLWIKYYALDFHFHEWKYHIFMHENKNFAHGMNFLPHKFSWVVGPPTNILSPFPSKGTCVKPHNVINVAKCNTYA